MERKEPNPSPFAAWSKFVVGHGRVGEPTKDRCRIYYG